ncbi:MAG: hypothetical protein AB8B73_07225 [Ekhidna sp.]
MEYVKMSSTIKTNEVTFKNPITTFIKWADNQQFYRLVYLVGMLLFQTCITIPFGLLALTANDGGSIQLGILVIPSFMVITSNLAALPTKYTIPIFVLVTAISLTQLIYNAIIVLT